MKKIFILFSILLLSFRGFSQSWSLLGNAGTNPPTNFLGTTDAQRLVFKTDSVERMTILANGNAGIGLTAPQTSLHVFSNTAGTQMAVSGAAPVIIFFPGTTNNASSAGQLGFSTAANNFVSGSQAGDFILSNTDTTHSLIFATNVSDGNGIERMRINKIGYIGIDEASPTARLDVNCATLSGQTNPSNVRLRSLQSGTGTVLVIDSNGYVYKAANGQTEVATAANSPLLTEMQSQMEELRNQVQELRSLLATRVALTSAESKSLNAESASWLGDIHPNPANSSTTLDYSLPAGVGAAFCQVYSLNGNIITSVSLPAVTGKSQVQLSTSQLTPGMYIYALVVDGKVLDTKKLAVMR